jgi:hypothetical protein
MRYLTAEAPPNPIPIAIRELTGADSVKYCPETLVAEVIQVDPGRVDPGSHDRT